MECRILYSSKCWHELGRQRWWKRGGDRGKVYWSLQLYSPAQLARRREGYWPQGQGCKEKKGETWWFGLIIRCPLHQTGLDTAHFLQRFPKLCFTLPCAKWGSCFLLSHKRGFSRTQLWYKADYGTALRVSLGMWHLLLWSLLTSCPWYLSWVNNHGQTTKIPPTDSILPHLTA